MTRTSTAWFAGSIGVTIIGLALATPFPVAGAILAVAGILGLAGFLLYAFIYSTRHSDQWVWQTPHEPRREWLAEEAAKREAGEAPPDAAG